MLSRQTYYQLYRYMWRLHAVDGSWWQAEIPLSIFVISVRKAFMFISEDRFHPTEADPNSIEDSCMVRQLQIWSWVQQPV